ncbi:TetR family transcriptional regulator [Nocardia sp. MDA0666]|uniref:TetR/AcrR family transcriptional regulator n=1 Tax=Nocardia sp. MDA0666 TaxID=2135448 RepID=UPI000D13A7E5|nr:TetR/AcrR family transcriptional regulator [Nocardia sp. MDA0666]PSR69606.1 TetR family transcriptional regulator [Nocardia sp. MDA0666]
MADIGKARRPGGRSARVAAAVHRSVMELVAERGYGAFTVAEVATRAGVADTSIYRRWGTLEQLTAEVALGWLTSTSPIPDTGNLTEDLRAYAAGVARDISGPGGVAVLRLMIALSSAGDAGLRARDAFLTERGRQIQSMLDRAHARGERAPSALDVLDHLLAPMYIRVLFGAGPVTTDYAHELVATLLSHTPARAN